MFVSSEKFIEAHSGRLGDISIYGQESNYTTWRLAKMNLAIRGIDAQIAHGDTFHNDRHLSRMGLSEAPKEEFIKVDCTT
jgi:type I restriction enzyme M protein